ncbi:MAG: hypothetical protein IKX18_07855 [Muribaculaceae bacterium]|nr:hypothetical protein [Muribaculaceae bacterium]
MKNYLYFSLMIAAMFCTGTTLVSCSDDDEPGKTPAPKIISEMTSETVTITAVGNGVVKLYNKQSMEEVENPITYLRDFIDYTITFAATAKSPGKAISNTTVREVIITKSDKPKLIHAYSVIDSESDSTFFEFDFNLNKATGTIGVYKAVFPDNSSSERRFAFDTNVTFDQNTGTYSCSGDNITPRFKSGGNYVALDGYTVTNFSCSVCIKDLTYKIVFDCHGKHFDYSGGISKRYPITLHLGY